LKDGGEAEIEEAWSPSITIGTPVTIPEDYIDDLTVRMSLYRRLATMADESEMESFAAEMIDRFGPLPDEVKQLIKLMTIKILCRAANIEKVDAGPKGVTIAFRDGAFANPAGLVHYVTREGPFAKVRPDMRVTFLRGSETAAERLDVTHDLLRTLVDIAEKKKAA